MSMLMRSIFPLPHKRSSAIVGLGHDRSTSTLAVRWRSGNVSFHHGFPREMFAEFLGAESLGKFFRERVRGRFTKSFARGREQEDIANTPGHFSNSRDDEGVITPPLCNQVPAADCSTATVSQYGNPETRYQPA